MVVCTRRFMFVIIQLSSIGLMVMMMRMSEATFISKKALFVFGDSVADTGNHRAVGVDVSTEEKRPWRYPYGITWPGIPAGHYSDGYVFTEYYATYLGVNNPLTYKIIKDLLLKWLPYQTGINFASGGSGVFPTTSYSPNVSTQITQLQDFINRGLVTKDIITASTALVTVNGNDYSKYLNDGGTIADIPTFIQKVVEQIKVDVVSLQDLGFKKLAISNFIPIGCVPLYTKSLNYSSCNNALNSLAKIHNSLLATKITTLQSLFPDVEFITLDFDKAFNTTLFSGTSSANPPKFKPCCEGIGNAICGDVDSNGQPLYTVCASPAQFFFWDETHRTSAGWKSISSVLFQ